jgi:sedoheptulokinase
VKDKKTFEVNKEKISVLYTWQDARCNPEFLESLPKPNSHLKCYTGYGCVTLLWLLKNKPATLDNYNYAATVQDFVVAMLCGLEKPVMSDQNAASWGYFNTQSNEWNNDVLESVGFPVELLPRILKSGGTAGTLSNSWNEIPEGTPVGPALGDLQCSILATLESEEDAVMNISTSAQIAFIAKDISVLNSNTIQYVPYFDNSHLVVAASLNGGNVLAAFVKMLQQWLLEFEISIPQTKIWEKLIASSSVIQAPTSMKITPLLLGERHSPLARAAAENIDLSNTQLGHVFKSICDGLIENLHHMMPKEILRDANIKRIVGNGSCLSRNAVLQKAVVHYYGIPLEFTSEGDAAKGAALATMF